MILLVGAALAAPLSTCARAFTPAELQTSIDGAEAAFVNLDGASLAAAREEAELRLQCAGERLDPLLVARFHRMEALAAFVTGEQARVPQALAGALTAEPGHEIPTALVPEEHAIRAQRVAATRLLRQGTARPLLRLEAGSFVVDGDAANRLSTGHAGVVQQLDAAGRVLETRYVWPEDELGAWTGSDEPEPQGRAVVPWLGLDVGVALVGPSRRPADPSAFGGFSPALDLGVVVPVGERFGLLPRVGYSQMIENATGRSAKIGDLGLALHLRLGEASGVALGPVVSVARMDAPDVGATATGFLFGGNLFGHLALAQAGPVGIGLRMEADLLATGAQAVGLFDAGVQLSWEGARP